MANPLGAILLVAVMIPVFMLIGGGYVLLLRMVWRLIRDEWKRG